MDKVCYFSSEYTQYTWSWWTRYAILVVNIHNTQGPGGQGMPFLMWIYTIHKVLVDKVCYFRSEYTQHTWSWWTRYAIFVMYIHNTLGPGGQGMLFLKCTRIHTKIQTHNPEWLAFLLKQECQSINCSLLQTLNTYSLLDPNTFIFTVTKKNHTHTSICTQKNESRKARFSLLGQKSIWPTILICIDENCNPPAWWLGFRWWPTTHVPCFKPNAREDRWS